MKTGADFIFAGSGAVELTTRKANGIVRGEGWCGNPSDSRPNFFGRQHLTFDKGGKGVGDFRGRVRIWKGWCGARVGAAIYLLSMLCTATEKIGYCDVPD